MEYEKYNEIDGMYEEVEILPLSQKALMHERRISSKDLPPDVYKYDIRDSDLGWDPCSIEKRVVVNHNSCIITYKPINLSTNGFMEINGYEDIRFTDNSIYPYKVHEWINEMRELDNNSTEVLEFINGFIKHATNNGIDENMFREVFRNGYCYHFASILKETFGRGQLYITAPIGHVVWRDDDDRYYDIEGEYIPKEHDMEVFIPAICGSMAEDFKHISSDTGGSTKEQINEAMKDWANKFPNC